MIDYIVLSNTIKETRNAQIQKVYGCFVYTADIDG